MILGDARHSIRRELEAACIDYGDAEADLFMCHALNMTRVQIYSEPERSLTPTALSNLRQLVNRRIQHEPLAYILGSYEFHGIEFYIDHRTMIPRPETELLVQEAIDSAQHHLPSAIQPTVADIGTGSGAIAISLALALPQVTIYATDISIPALLVAHTNRQRHRVEEQVKLLQGHLLEPLPRQADMIVANLPYIANREMQTLSPEIADFEPIIALAGGDEGLDEIRLLLDQAADKLRSGGYLLLEIGQGQDEVVSSMIRGRFPQASVAVIPDLHNINRVIRVHTQDTATETRTRG